MRPFIEPHEMLLEKELIRSTYNAYSEEVRRLLKVYNTDNLSMGQVNRAIETAIKSQGKLEKSKTHILESFFDSMVGSSNMGLEDLRFFLSMFDITEGIQIAGIKKS